MTLPRWWVPVVVTGVAHATFLAVPLHFSERSHHDDETVVLHFRAPPPPAEPPPPEPPPPEELPLEPPPPPPEEPPPKSRERAKTPEPPSEPEPPPPEPEHAPEPEPEPPPVAPTAPPEPTPPTLPERRPSPAPEREPEPSPIRRPTKADFRAYAQNMRASFLRHRRYPPAALRMGLEGVAKVKLTVDRRGRLVGEPSLVASTGHAVLDEEALRVVRVAAPFAPLPENTEKDEMVFVIPIDFRIQGS